MYRIPSVFFGLLNEAYQFATFRDANQVFENIQQFRKVLKWVFISGPPSSSKTVFLYLVRFSKSGLSRVTFANGSVLKRIGNYAII